MAPPPWQHTTEARLVAVALLGALQAPAPGWLAASDAMMLNVVGAVKAPLQVTVSWPLVVPERVIVHAARGSDTVTEGVS